MSSPPPSRRAHVPGWCVLEWTDPPFSAGHWVPDMVTAAGGEAVLGASGRRSEQIEWAAVAAAEPDVIVVAPCGYRLEGATAAGPSTARDRKSPPGRAGLGGRRRCGVRAARAAPGRRGGGPGPHRPSGRGGRAAGPVECGFGDLEARAGPVSVGRPLERSLGARVTTDPRQIARRVVGLGGHLGPSRSTDHAHNVLAAGPPLRGVEEVGRRETEPGDEQPPGRPLGPMKVSAGPPERC